MLVTNPFNLLGRQEASEGLKMRYLDPNMTDTDYLEYKKGYITVKAIQDITSLFRDHCFCDTLLTKEDKDLYHSIHNNFEHIE